MINFKSESNCLQFSTGSLTTIEQYEQQMNINSTIYGQNINFTEYCKKIMHEDDVRFDPDICMAHGRPFELYFRYGVTSDHIALVTEKCNYEKKWGPESDLGHHVSIHAINNPLCQQFNYQVSKHQENGDAGASCIDKQLASLGVFITVTDPLKMRREAPHRSCCLYLVVNNTMEMKDCWKTSIVESISLRISQLEILDSFGICLFNELGIRHFVSSYDEQALASASDTIEDDDDDDSNRNANIVEPFDGAIGHDSKLPRVYKVSEWSNVRTMEDGNSPIAWRNRLQTEVHDWLATRQPKTRKAIHAALKENRDLKVNGKFNKNGLFGVNISTPLVQTLCFLEADAIEYKKNYFRQIVFIHHGKKIVKMN